jgi:hypothetical protein
MNHTQAFSRTLITLALCLSAGAASAHIGYGGRNFGTINGNSVSISNQTVTSNFGWADASDSSLVFDANYAAWHTQDSATYSAASFTDGVDNLYFGDTHKGKAFRFRLDTAQTLNIRGSSNASATASSVGGLTAGFSVYRGLAGVAPYPSTQTSRPPSADHDFAAASQAWRTVKAQSLVGAGSNHLATQGSWNALGDWSIGGDGDLPGDGTQLSTFEFMGSAYTTTANGVASGTFTLGPGDYTIFVGGNALASKNAANAFKAYGLTLTVSAVPEPQAWLLMLAGVSLLACRGRRSARP